MTTAIKLLESLEIDHFRDLKEMIQQMLDAVLGLQVEDHQSYCAITSIYAKAREWQKLIDQKRKEAIEPARRIVSTINDKAKEVSSPIEQIIELAKSKVAQYNILLERKRLEEVNAAAKLLDIDDPVVLPQSHIGRGDGAMAYTKTEKKFRLVDINKVPLKYLHVDNALIERDIALGIANIPGIEIYEETKTYLRKR